jgi:hypothetical protein
MIHTFKIVWEHNDQIHEKEYQTIAELKKAEKWLKANGAKYVEAKVVLKKQDIALDNSDR